MTALTHHVSITCSLYSTVYVGTKKLVALLPRANKHRIPEAVDTNLSITATSLVQPTAQGDNPIENVFLKSVQSITDRTCIIRESLRVASIEDGHKKVKLAREVRAINREFASLVQRV